MALTKIPSSLLDTSGGFDLQGNITLGDNEKIILGDSSDLQIYHNGSNSYIDDAGTGALNLRSSGIYLEKANGAEVMISAIADGAVTLYHDGSTKLATSSAGATVTGTLTVTGDLDITGNVNSYNVTDLDVTDQTITLGAGQTEANSGGSGIIIDGSSASILWDETNDEWDFNKTINVLADSDIQAHIGRAKIGYMGFDDFAGFAHIDNATTGSYALLQYSTGETYLNAASGRDINIRINNSNVALFNSEGNFGIGTTSLTNNTLGKTTYFGNNTSTITGDSSQARFWLGNNWYYNSGDKFIDTGYANLYTQQSGTHQFLTSTASGSAGQAVTFTNVLTIDSSGNIGIGTTNPLNKLSVVESNTSNYYNRSDATAVIQDALPTLLIAHDGNSTNDYAELRLGNNQTTYYPYSAYIRGVQNSGIDRYRLEFGTSNFANATTKMTINELGNVGIGESNPQTKLHVYGTSPVIRVSDDGTTGYSTLELRQQNSSTEGTELMYDSGTGHTHLNTVYGADLKIATNTGSFGTTSTNTRLTVKSDGEIHVGKSNVSTDRIKFVGTTNVFAPNTGDHTQGTRLSLFDASATSFYAIGIESNHMWFNADGGIFKFYQQAVQKVHIDGTNPMPLLRVGTDSTNAMTLGSVTAVFPYSGPTLIRAAGGAALTIHQGTNSAGGWSNISTSIPDFLRGTTTFSTINTSQQANIIVYLNSATKVYLVRDAGWNAVDLSGWEILSSTVTVSNSGQNCYVKYLPAGTHSLDNDSALYFFEAPIGP